MNAVLWHREGLLEDLGELLPVQLAGVDRLVKLLELPRDQGLQGGGLQVQPGGDPVPDPEVSQLLLSPDLQDPLHSKPPVLSCLASEQGEQDTLGVGVPSSCPNVRGDYVLDLRIGIL